MPSSRPICTAVLWPVVPLPAPDRYCPSIESKVVQFPERTGHQVFVEPEDGRLLKAI